MFPALTVVNSDSLCRLLLAFCDQSLFNDPLMVGGDLTEIDRYFNGLPGHNYKTNG